MVFKAADFEDLEYTTASTIETPEVVSAKIMENFWDRTKFARVTFDRSDKGKLSTFMKVLSDLDVTLTVNGEEYERVSSVDSSKKTFSAAQNSAYGTVEFLHISAKDFVSGSNSVVISSPYFEDITLEIENP